MKAEAFTNRILNLGIESIIGVPDSTLKEFCDYLNTDGRKRFEHAVPPNEGAAVGMAVGVYLSTGHPACVYMQNSGLGNIVNPLTSLANQAVYEIPMLYVIGWRGEPGLHDEPQHKFMGEITEDLLSVLEIPHRVIGADTDEETLDAIFREAAAYLGEKRQYALVVRRNAFEKRNGQGYHNDNPLGREAAIGEILKALHSEDVVVSTTGKISREVYEVSDRILGHHSQSFLTVGGMGHASMIALGIAKHMPEKKVFCLDGDGALLMHMGALPFIARQAPENYIHICLNNDVHESVGGMPTGACGQSYAGIAAESGYRRVWSVDREDALREVLSQIREETGPVFLEVKVSVGSRKDLGRPKETAVQNKEMFMSYHGVTL